MEKTDYEKSLENYTYNDGKHIFDRIKNSDGLDDRENLDILNEIVLWKMVFYNEQLFALFYLLNVAAGVAMPIVVAKLVERCPWRALRLCFGLK